MSEDYPDKKGYPVREFDILKVFHFKASNRNHYMYKIALTHPSGVLAAYDIKERVQIGEEGHSCWLKLLGDFEIVNGLDKKEGYLPTQYYERRKLTTTSKGKE